MLFNFVIFWQKHTKHTHTQCRPKCSSNVHSFTAATLAYSKLKYAYNKCINKTFGYTRRV